MVKPGELITHHQSLPIENPISEFPFSLELEASPEAATVEQYATNLVSSLGSDFLTGRREAEQLTGLASLEAATLVSNFRWGVELSQQLSEELLAGKDFPWWDLDAYRQATTDVFEVTSPGQFVNVLGAFALHRMAGAGPIMITNHETLFPDDTKGYFLDALTNATVTNFGQGYPLQMVAANTAIRLTGGAQCPPYHPGPFMSEAAKSLFSILPISTEGAKVAWFNSGGDAVSVGIAAAEKYTQEKKGENGRRMAVFFKEAYHGNIEGRAGRATSGINKLFHPQDRNSLELEYPNHPQEVEPVLAQLQAALDSDTVSCIVFESTQGDGGGVSLHPDFFVQMVKLSLDYDIPLVCDEVQSGFGRSGRYFDVEYLLDYWYKSDYVISGAYPHTPPMIIAVAKSMTNGAVPGSAVILPKEFAVLGRAQGLNTYSAHPGTLAATIATVELMTPNTLNMVTSKRQVFEEAIDPYIPAGQQGFIKGVRGNGLHLFLAVEDNQLLQAELMGRKRVLTGTVARDGLRVHAPINAPDVVWQALGEAIGQVAQDISAGKVSPQARQILTTGPSGLAQR